MTYYSWGKKTNTQYMQKPHGQVLSSYNRHLFQSVKGQEQVMSILYNSTHRQSNENKTLMSDKYKLKPA